jgi:hypothetical protein
MSSDHNILRRFFANTNRLGEGNLLPNLRTVTFCGRRTQLMESYLSIDARTYRTFHPGAMAYNRATLREHMRRSKRSTSIQPPIHAVRQPGASVLTRRRGRSIPAFNLRQTTSRSTRLRCTPSSLCRIGEVSRYTTADLLRPTTLFSAKGQFPYHEGEAHRG